MLGNAFIDSPFNYAPLIWIFCKKGVYSKIQKIHHKTLKVIYQSNNTYEELLKLNEIVSIFQRHLTCSFFILKEFPYNHRKGQVLSFPLARSTYY